MKDSHVMTGWTFTLVTKDKSIECVVPNMESSHQATFHYISTRIIVKVGQACGYILQVHLCWKQIFVADFVDYYCFRF